VWKTPVVQRPRAGSSPFRPQVFAAFRYQPQIRISNQGMGRL
jgi:hypothetical protein